MNKIIKEIITIILIAIIMIIIDSIYLSAISSTFVELCKQQEWFKKFPISDAHDIVE